MSDGASSKDLESATRLATAMMSLSILLRGGTFLINAVLLRFVTPELLGIVQVRLLLLFYTIHTIVKDPYHKVFLDKAVWNQHHRSRVISSLWSILLVAIFFSLTLSLIWISPAIMEIPDRADYSVSVCVYGAAGLVIILGEPFVILARYGGFTKLEVVSESVAFLFQGTLTLVLVLLYPEWGLFSFAVPQLSFSVIRVSIFISYFSYSFATTRDSSSLPISTFRACFPPLPPSFTPSILRGVWSFITYTLLKQLLTNGEQYVMTIFTALSFSQQGIYSVVHNLGSMAARFIFKPLEESFAVYFTKSLPRGSLPSSLPEEVLHSSRGILVRLFRVVLLIGFVFAAFSPGYSQLLLHLYGGRMLSESDAPFLLKCFSLYVLLLAVNGISECFCFSVMGQQQIQRYNWFMVGYSVVYLVLAVFFTNQLGAVGLILSNSVNLSIRIIHSFVYIEQYFEKFDSILWEMFPSPLVLIALLIAFIITNVSNYYCSELEFYTQVLHVAIGGVCLLANGALVLSTDRWYLQQISRFLPRFKTE